ncbi:right-handed parallel beta-helix repeat-containing protein [Peribacillus butanolivorans]|uniref:right-handed parallel beta-helix repeat-containing protein n=1 Tax=Peribacillus butanolivorans TaxID=421767 RepID=UPI003689C84C
MNNNKGIIYLTDYEDYKVDRDGSWDWTTALEKAVNDTPVGGTLIIPTGIFEVGKFTPKSGITIRGNGTIKRIPNGSNKSLLNISDLSNLVIENITIDANDLRKPYTISTVSNRNCIELDGSSENVTIKNVKLKNAGRDGIYIGEVKSGDGKYPLNCTISNVEIDNSTRNGISVVCAEFINIENPKVTNFGLCGINIEPNPLSTLNRNISVYRGIIIANSEAISIPLQCTIGSAIENYDKFSNITFNGVTSVGNGDPNTSTVRNYKFHNVSIINNDIQNYVTGIVADGQSLVMGNKLSKPSLNKATKTTSAILVYGDVTVSSNLIDGSGYNGIVVYKGNNSIISENLIYDVGKVGKGYGIYTYGSELNIITINQCIDKQETKTMECGILIRLNANLGVKNIVTDNVCMGATDIPFKIGSPELQLKVADNFEV